MSDAPKSPWRRMSEAPRDGTVILLKLTDSGTPYPARSTMPGSWIMVWDHYIIHDWNAEAWMPIPDFRRADVMIPTQQLQPPTS